MDDRRPNAPGTPRVPESIGHPVGWCDPRLCQPDATGVPGGWHYAMGDAICLSHQREVLGPGELQPPTLHVITDQHCEDEPTYCLYSESAKASSRSRHRGMDLALTRQEAERLRDELTRWLEATA